MTTEEEKRGRELGEIKERTAEMIPVKSRRGGIEQRESKVRVRPSEEMKADTAQWRLREREQKG